MSSRIISIISEKGGVSKTTSAIHIAAELANKGFKVVVLDFDTTQANATTQLIGQIWATDNYKKGICSVIMNESSIDDVIYPTKRDNLFIIPSEKFNQNGSPFNVEGTLKDMGLEGYMFLKECIEESVKLSEMDFIIIDNGPTLGITTIATLIASDYYCIPVRTESFSLDSIAPSIETAIKVQKSNKLLSPLGIYVTLEDKRNKKNLKIANAELNVICEQYDIHLFENRIPVNANFASLPRGQRLIFDLKTSNRGRAEYQMLTEEILERIMSIETNEQLEKTNSTVTNKVNSMEAR